MRRPGLKPLNRVNEHPTISDLYFKLEDQPSYQDEDSSREWYSVEAINKWNFASGSLTRINRRDFRINREDYYKL